MNNITIHSIIGLAFACICWSTLAYAQEGQTLSVTPPLFQVSLLPADVWQSSVRVVNSNPYPLTVFAEIANFRASGELGQGDFEFVNKEDNERLTLAEWVTLPEGPHIIPPEQSAEIPFLVELPKDAPPGGHYAAILISTEQQNTSGERLAVRTSQSVTSLFFVRVEGDVEEKGSIREFSPIASFLQSPDVEFSLRFENKGNVHLQPRGNIVITNMWGTERGIIPINHQTHFGNVLPQSIRDFKFAWKSDFKVTDIGRYKAEASLVYGQNGFQSVDSVTYFWVIPVKGTLITVAVIGFFITLIVLMVKAYVRKMLALAGVDVTVRAESTILEQERVRKTYQRVSAPLRSGVLDLRYRLHTAEESVSIISTLWRFILSYKVFFASIVVLALIIATITIYVLHATENRSDYEVIIDHGGSKTVIQGSDLQHNGQ